MRNTNMKSALLALALLTPSACFAADTGEPGKAVEAILTACVTSASSGAPVDTTGLLAFFKADEKNEKFTSLPPLPRMQLLVSNKGTFRCVLMGKQDVANTDFARAMKEAIVTWPRMEHSPTKSLETSYIAHGDAQQGIHKVIVTIEMTDMKLWEVMVWDAGLPK
jgi:hypothetical protein